MAQLASFEDRAVEWKKFILEHWTYFRIASEKLHKKHGPGAVVIEIDHAPTTADMPEGSALYVTLKNAEAVMPNLSLASLRMYLADSDPRDEALFLLSDFQQGNGQIWRQRKREDGTPLPDPDLTWRNRARTCPSCGTSFVSVQARGQCPNCGKTFVAHEGSS